MTGSARCVVMSVSALCREPTTLSMTGTRINPSGLVVERLVDDDSAVRQ
jgi:hypothetical protein